jgi:hypothetical protein
LARGFNLIGNVNGLLIMRCQLTHDPDEDRAAERAAPRAGPCWLPQRKHGTAHLAGEMKKQVLFIR